MLMDMANFLLSFTCGKRDLRLKHIRFLAILVQYFAHYEGKGTI